MEEITACKYFSASLSTTVSTSSGEPFTGALESASARYRDLPGQWRTVYWNRIRRRRKRSTLGGSESKLLLPKIGTSGL